jgi:hypothetical protein
MRRIISVGLGDAPSYRRIRNDIMLLSRFIGRRKLPPAERRDPVEVDGRAA